MGLRVYVAGPIAQGDQWLNVRKAIEAGQIIRTRGHYPFIPHLCNLWHLVVGEERTFSVESWMDYDFAWLDTCHVLVRLPGPSNGSDREVARAWDRQMPVFMGLDEFRRSSYWTMDKMPERKE